MRARRAIGLSAFYFGWLHSLVAFSQLQGFSGLGFLNQKYITAIIYGLIGLLIMTAMAITANDWAVDKLGFKKWKNLHRLIYVGSWLIIIHVLMLGSHYTNLSSWVARASFAALALLLVLEVVRFNKFLFTRYAKLNYSAISAMAITSLALIVLGYYAGSIGNKVGGLGIHTQHLQQAQKAGVSPTEIKRFSTAFEKPDNILPGQPVTMSFQLYDASSGNPAPPLLKLYDKLAHLVIVDNELAYYSHVHPEQVGGKLTIQSSFPKPGRYHLYLNVHPIGATEQQFAYFIDVGGSSGGTSTQAVDSQLNKTFGEYQVSLSSSTLRAADMTNGRQKLSFTFKDKDSQPVTTLKPYLAAFGHLVMINQQTYDYIHVHPADTRTPAPNDSAGPSVEFQPLGLYGPIKPGTYRLFGQFNPDNSLILTEYTVKVE